MVPNESVRRRPRTKGGPALAAGVLVALAAGTHWARREPSRGGPTDVGIVQIVQTLGEGQSAVVEESLQAYARAEPNVRFRVVYRPSGAAPSGADAVVIRALAPGEIAGDAAAPLFRADYVVLAYRKDLLPVVPSTFEGLVAAVAELRDKGRVTHGLGVPTDAYVLFPLLGPALFEGDTAVRERVVRSAFDVLFEARFVRRVTPAERARDDAAAELARGGVAAALVEEAALEALRRELGGELGIAPVPKLAAAPPWRFNVGTVYAALPMPSTDVRATFAIRGLLAYLRGAGGARLARAVGKVPETTEDAAPGPLEADLAFVAHAPSWDRKDPRVRASQALMQDLWDELRAGRLAPSDAARALVAGIDRD